MPIPVEQAVVEDPVPSPEEQPEEEQLGEEQGKDPERSATVVGVEEVEEKM